VGLSLARGQSSVELIAIIGIVLLAFLVFFLLGQNQSIEVQKSRERTEAANSVSDLASAAKSVYSQGSGAKKQVQIRLPSGYEPNRSSVGNNAIRISVDGNDYVETLDFPVQGSLPQTSGVHWIWVSSSGGAVRIGYSLISMNRLSISSIMPMGGTSSEAMVISSVWDNPLNLTLESSFPEGLVSLSLDHYSFALDPLESEGISVMLVSKDNSSGFNSGSITIFATDGSVNESIIMPVTVEVSANTSASDSMYIIPGVYNISSSAGQNHSAYFQVCSRSGISAVSFNASSSDAGEWVGSLGALSQIQPDRCRSKRFDVNVPEDADEGLQNGYIFANGSKGERASIFIQVNVSRPSGDSQGPNISDIAMDPKKAYTSEPIVISATASDESSTIGSCAVSMDGGSWSAMDAVDGTYDEQAEIVRYTYFSGLTIGDHTAAVRCSDEGGNSNQASYDFPIMKEILYATKSSDPDAIEAQWISWIRGGQSWEGNTWGIDVVKASDIISGSIDCRYYSTIVASQWDNGLSSGLRNHLSYGGSVVLLGQANVFGPRSLGFSASIGDKSRISEIRIIQNEHYISEPLPKGDVSISQTGSYVYYVSPHSADVLAQIGGNQSSTPLWVSGGLVSWGFSDIDNGNESAANISTRVLDYAINRSTVTPG